MFSLFINELALDIINDGRHGVSLSSDFVQLVILLFADDMILLSETVIGLQTQLNSLFSACLLYTSPSPRDMLRSRMPSSA